MGRKVATLCLGTRKDAGTWEKGCQRLGYEVYANPATVFTDTVGDTGNMKLYGCGNIVVRNNYVHDSPRFSTSETPSHWRGW